MIRTLLLGLFLGATLLFSASDVFAQNTVFPTQIVPSTCGGAGQLECNVCDFEELLITVMRFIVAFSVVVATGLFAWAGAIMVTSQDNSGKRDEAKGIFLNVVLGLIVVLGAYLFVDTIMKTFLKNADGSISSEFGPWNDVICPVGFIPKVVESNPVFGTASEGGTVVPRTGGLTHAGAMAQFGNANITVTSTAGPGGVSGTCSGSGCTNCSGLQQGTIDQTILVANACGSSNVVVTGCTEGGVHAGGAVSHGSGAKIDLDDSASLNSCLQSKLVKNGSRSGDPVYNDKCGNEYVKESNHWDITVTKRCTIDSGRI